MHFGALGSQKVVSAPGDIGPGAVSRDPSPVPPIAEVPAVTYACSAVHGFFRSIALSVENSLQDTLRYDILGMMYIAMCTNPHAIATITRVSYRKGEWGTGIPLPLP